MTKKKQLRTKVISTRVTEEQHAHVKMIAGGKPVGDVVFESLFPEEELPKLRKTKKPPTIIEKLLAKLLAMVHCTRIPNNLNQLTKSANSGQLELTDEDRDILHAAYRYVQEIRNGILEIQKMLRRLC